MEQITLWKRLKKHYILVLIGSLILLVAVSFGVYRAVSSRATTPIAHISPEDSLKNTILPGKLERYQKELIEQEKQAYQRKAALDEIVSMDFSQETKVAEIGKSKSILQPAKPLENVLQKEETQQANSPKAVWVKKPLQRINNKGKQVEGQRKTTDGFYTIKRDKSNGVQAQQAGDHTFIKALIHGDQKIKGGGTVCLRLMEEATFGGSVYPKNTILYGRISSGMSGRLRILVSQIKEVKVHLSVYDQDYSEGVAYQIQEPISEIARQSRDETLDEVLSSLPYGGVAGGLAGLGRSLGRRAKQVKTLYLADGYEVFITQAN